MPFDRLLWNLRSKGRLFLFFRRVSIFGLRSSTLLMVQKCKYEMLRIIMSPALALTLLLPSSPFVPNIFCRVIVTCYFCQRHYACSMFVSVLFRVNGANSLRFRSVFSNWQCRPENALLLPSHSTRRNLTKPTQCTHFCSVFPKKLNLYLIYRVYQENLSGD